MSMLSEDEIIEREKQHFHTMEDFLTYLLPYWVSSSVSHADGLYSKM